LASGLLHRAGVRGTGTVRVTGTVMVTGTVRVTGTGCDYWWEDCSAARHGNGHGRTGEAGSCEAGAFTRRDQFGCRAFRSASLHAHVLLLCLSKATKTVAVMPSPSFVCSVYCRGSVGQR
jgi:hypothetical protein